MKKISFKKRPTPIPIDYRPIYRVSLVLLILYINCIGKRSSLLRLHLFSWSISNSKNMEIVNKYLVNTQQFYFQLWGIDPALNRALDYAIGEELCGIKSTKKEFRYVLTSKGELFCKAILDEKELFVEEISFLNNLGKDIFTEELVLRISNLWKNYETKNKRY